jgi:predicted CDP-diglyceride synthetase/phosphatidate cytidylyltransferase
MTREQARAFGRLHLSGLLLATLLFGIATRKIHLGVMVWDKSAGDALYAVAVYFALALALPRLSRQTLALLAMSFCFGIEFLQLTGVPSAVSRHWPWAHWILGSTFAWHDVACYAVGVALAALVHSLAGSPRTRLTGGRRRA